MDSPYHVLVPCSSTPPPCAAQKQPGTLQLIGTSNCSLFQSSCPGSVESKTSSLFSNASFTRADQYTGRSHLGQIGASTRRYLPLSALG
jgi:hypothetical protein